MYQEQNVFTEKDLELIGQKGVSNDQLKWQIGLFTQGVLPTAIDRPCQIGDGLVSFPENEAQKLAQDYDNFISGKDIVKFVPASGAATRMFKFLHGFNPESPDPDSKLFFNDLSRFPFFQELNNQTGGVGDKSQAEIRDLVLESKGLNYSFLPKALIKFHQYGEYSRTAFEEHLIEGGNYARNEKGTIRLHFTVSPEHTGYFKEHLARVSPGYEKEYGASFEVSFSIQNPSTDTMAVEVTNQPFRGDDGNILFRPGGHGALLENLNDLDEDIVFIKNIDNVTQDWLKEKTLLYKKVLGAYMIRTQTRTFHYLESLESSPSPDLLSEIVEFGSRQLNWNFPEMKSLEGPLLKDFLVSKLNRPIRVCGMVKATGAVGGGPFWVRRKDDSVSLQIVEQAQIDSTKDDQIDLFNRSTHFNPNDIVCGIKDYQGNSFDLTEYRDMDAAFITEKSKDGRVLKALEYPGLWNGSMAFWNTVFVEVPSETFNPVKTVNDLLKEAHQPKV